MTITKLTVAEGGVSKPTAIAGAFERYYGNLLQEQPAAKDNPVDILNLVPKVSEEVRKEIGGPITAGEVERAIATLSTGKSPGPDGIGYGFYKVFSDVLAPLLTVILEVIRKRGLMPPSMRRSHVVLIPKKIPDGGPPRVTDFRRISLMKSDYKILAKIICRRLETGLAHVIGAHQRCAFCGRSIASNLHAIRVVSEAAETRRVDPVAVVQLDLSKAFDRVDRKYLLALLHHCGVGETMEDIGGGSGSSLRTQITILQIFSVHYCSRGVPDHVELVDGQGARVDCATTWPRVAAPPSDKQAGI